MDVELTELQAYIAAALIGHTKMVKGADPMSRAEIRDCIDLSASLAEDIERIKSEDKTDE